jgi:hypothetical protein
MNKQMKKTKAKESSSWSTNTAAVVQASRSTNGSSSEQWTLVLPDRTEPSRSVWPSWVPTKGREQVGPMRPQVLTCAAQSPCPMLSLCRDPGLPGGPEFHLAQYLSLALVLSLYSLGREARWPWPLVCGNHPCASQAACWRLFTGHLGMQGSSTGSRGHPAVPKLAQPLRGLGNAPAPLGLGFPNCKMDTAFLLSFPLP